MEQRKDDNAAYTLTFIIQDEDKVRVSVNTDKEGLRTDSIEIRVTYCSRGNVSPTLSRTTREGCVEFQRGEGLDFY